jgi:hypothetical protein
LFTIAACGTGKQVDGDATIDADPAADTDGDTILDVDEGHDDSDGDTVPDLEDEDSDGDTIPDAVESGDELPGTPPVDSDEDGTPDYLDWDSDGNGISDADEETGDLDGDTIPDYADDDDDGDRIPDIEEIGGDPRDPVDWDGDGMPDYRDTDSDNDSIKDSYEWTIDYDGDTIPDRHDLDSDGDTIPDAEEAGDDDPETEPRDLDGDLRPDFRDQDSDWDGLSDRYENQTGCMDPYHWDSDRDGIADTVEDVAGTDPCDEDDHPLVHGDLVFVVEYNWPRDPPDPPIGPDPEMDRVVFTSETSADIRVQLRDEEDDGLDIALLVDRASPGVVGEWPDPRDPTVICESGLAVDDLTGDTVPDAFTGLEPGTIVCFEVHPVLNDFVEWIRAAPLVYRLSLDIATTSGTTLDTRQIYFLIPPDTWVEVP